MNFDYRFTLGFPTVSFDNSVGIGNHTSFNSFVDICKGTPLSTSKIFWTKLWTMLRIKLQKFRTKLRTLRTSHSKMSDQLPPFYSTRFSGQVPFSCRHLRLLENTLGHLPLTPVCHHVDYYLLFIIMSLRTPLLILHTILLIIIIHSAHYLFRVIPYSTFRVYTLSA